MQTRILQNYLIVPFLLLLLGACAKKDQQTSSEAPSTSAPASENLEDAVAVIDDVVITAKELKRQIDRQSAPIRARYSSLEAKKEFLDSLIRFEVLAKEAFARKLDQDPDVVRSMKQVMIQKLMKSTFQDAMKPSDVTEQEMRAFYEEHTKEYNKPEEVRASVIVVSSDAQAKKILKLAKSKENDTPIGFRKLVTEHSTDTLTKNRGGDLRYFSRDTTKVPAPVVAKAFTMQETGSIGGPIKVSNDKHYLIKLTGRRKASTKTFEDVKRQIQNRIYRQKRTENQKKFIADLRAKANIKVHEDKLEKIEVSSPPSPAAGRPGAIRNLPKPTPTPRTPGPQKAAPVKAPTPPKPPAPSPAGTTPPN